jgi:WD40 repeat protein
MSRTLSAAKVALYEKLLRQLQDDGFTEEAKSLQQKLKLTPREDKDALLHAVEQAPAQWEAMSLEPHPPLRPAEACLNLNADVASRSDFVMLKKRYVAQAKGSFLNCAFAPDGKICAAGNSDGSVKVFDTMKMKAGSGFESTEETTNATVASFTDHHLSVTALGFHPRQPTLVSGSLDTTIKIYDVVNPAAAKKALAVLNDVYGILAVQVHPCGDYVLSGTTHPRVRLHDLETLQCFATMQVSHEHTNSVQDVRYSSDGRAFATASADGTVGIWDAVSHRRVNTITGHQQQAVLRVLWSRNLNYLLTAGADNRVRLWDMRKGEELSGLWQPASSNMCSWKMSFLVKSAMSSVKTTGR